MRFGDRDPGERAREQARQPPVPYRGAGVGGDQPAVPKPGGIPQVDVVVATDELHHCLDEDGVAATAVAGGDGHGGDRWCPPDRHLRRGRHAAPAPHLVKAERTGQLMT